MCFGLRKPEAHEFGGSHMQDQVLYLEIGGEMKSLSWFLGMEETRHHVAWPLAAMDVAAMYPAVQCGTLVADGSWPIDDLELPTTTPVRSIHSDQTSDSCSCDKLFGAIGAIANKISNEGKRYLVLTERTNPQAFLEEVKENMVLTEYNQLPALVDYVVSNRNDNTNFRLEKELVRPMYRKVMGKDVVIRSKEAMSEFMAEIWTALVAKSPIVRIDEVVELTEVEILAYFLEYCKPPTFIDGRAVLQMAVDQESRPVLKHNDRVFVGRCVEDMGRTFVLSPGVPDEAQVNVRLDFSSGYDRFNVTVIGSMPSRGRKPKDGASIDMGKAKWFITEMEDKLLGCSHAKPGYLTNVPLREFDTIVTTMGGMSTQGKVVVIPFDGSEETESWTTRTKYRVNVDPPVNQGKIIKLATETRSREKWTKAGVTDLWTTLLEFYKGHWQNKRLFKRPVGNREEQIHQVAEQVEFVYNLCAPYFKATMAVALGACEIERPYLLVHTDDTDSAPPNANDYKRSMLSYTGHGNSEPMICPDAKLFEACVSAGIAVGSGVELVRRIKGLNLGRVGGAIGKQILDPLVEKDALIAELGALQVQAPNVDTTLSDEIDPKKLRDKDLAAVFAVLTIQDCIEDDVFLNTGERNTKRVVRPRDLVINLLEYGSVKVYTLMQSIYAYDKREAVQA